MVSGIRSAGGHVDQRGNLGIDAGFAGDHPAVRMSHEHRRPVLHCKRGENYPKLAARFPAAPASAGLVTSAGFQQLSENAFLNDFANGVDPAKAHELYAVQASNVANFPTIARTTVAAWRSKPSWYAVSKQDRTINPELERYMAARMKAKTIEVDAGHLSLVSHPQEISDLILAAAGHGK